MQAELSFGKNLLRYFQHIETLNLLETHPLKISSLPNAEWLDRYFLETGQLSHYIVNQLFPESTENTPENMPESTSLREIWVAPFVGVLKEKRRGEIDPCCHALLPLLLPAYGSQDGVITLDEKRPFGFIPPSFLSPLSEQLPQLGGLIDYDRLLRQHYFDETGELLSQHWQDSFKEGYCVAKKVLNELTQNNWETLLKEAGYEICERALVFLRETSHVAPHVNLHVNLHVNPHVPSPVVQRYTERTVAFKPQLALSECLAESQVYCGHFSGVNVLEEAQYEALMHALLLPENEMQAIQMPMGLDINFLQAFVASKWVQSALLKEDCPILLYSKGRNPALPLGWVRLFERLNGGQNLFDFLQEKESAYERVATHLFTLVQKKWTLVNVWPNLSEVKTHLHKILSEHDVALKEGLQLLQDIQAHKKNEKEIYGAEAGAEVVLKKCTAQDARLEKQQNYLRKMLTKWQELEAAKTMFSKWLPAQKKRQKALQDKIYAACKQDELLSELPDALPLSEKLITKVRQLKVQRTKIHREMVKISDVVTSGQGTKRRFTAFLEKHLPEDHFLLQNWENLSHFECVSALQALMGKRLLLLAYCYHLTAFLIDWEQTGESDIKSPAVQALINGLVLATKDNVQKIKATADCAIIDNAQKVLPMLPIELLSKSKSAIFLGDEAGQMPALPTTAFLDEFDARDFDLADTEEALEDLQLQGKLAVNGSAFRMAQHVSYFQTPDLGGEGGMPTLSVSAVSPAHPFIQKIVKEDKINPLQQAPKSTTEIPLIGYGHIRGETLTKAGALMNPLEASCIVEWLLYKHAALSGQTVCIVTPFAQQKRLLQTLLRQHPLHFPVKTCTQLESQAYDVVIFSPVYTLSSKKPYVFDNVPGLFKTMMLAAKNHFLVFGQMDIFDPFTHSASGLFAKKLFHYGAPLLTDKALTVSFAIESSQLTILENVSQHQAQLQQALVSGKSMNILSSRVFEQDLVNLLQLDEDQCTNLTLYLGVNFPVASHKKTPREILEKLQQLSQKGVHIYWVRGVHSNALWDNETLFAEGNGPWLALSERSISEHMQAVISPEDLVQNRKQAFMAYLKAHSMRAFVNVNEKVEA